jgi:tetratricopeptide (TPR) repeat protein
MLKASQRGALAATAAVLIALVAFLQYNIDPLRRQPAIEPPKLRNAVSGRFGGAALPFEYSLAAVSGFRQVVAGLLWVRADSFFHQGNYDAILPLVRIITWLDPNFLDVYSTGAWHLMYNFTDEAQRSDRRYLPAGLALLNEGIANNPNVHDMYAEAGWSNFDKIKNYDEAVRYYSDAMRHNPDYTRVGHGLAHSLERAGRIDDAIAQWEQVLQHHKQILNDPKATQDQKNRARSGIETATKNLNLMRIRQVRREDDTKPPVDAQFSVKVVRVRPKVLEISGEMNLVGAKDFEERIWGPRDGGRVDVRLQDYGYRMPAPREFSFEVDNTLTIMQDQLSVRGGKSVEKGGLYIVTPGLSAVIPPEAESQAVYGFAKNEAPAKVGVPLRQALAGAAPLSAEGRRQLDGIATALFRQINKLPLDADVPAEGARNDPNVLAAMEKAGYHVATQNYYSLGKFGRQIDMSKDPRMYSFNKDRYELIVSFNPRTAPDFVQDRLGWSGEGLTDKRHLDTSTPGLRMLKKRIVLSRDDILGQGREVLE